MRDVIFFFAIVGIATLLIADKAAFDGALLGISHRGAPTAISVLRE